MHASLTCDISLSCKSISRFFFFTWFRLMHWYWYISNVNVEILIWSPHFVFHHRSSRLSLYRAVEFSNFNIDVYQYIYTILGVVEGVYYFQLLRIFAKQDHHLVKVLWRRSPISCGRTTNYNRQMLAFRYCEYWCTSMTQLRSCTEHQRDAGPMLGPETGPRDSVAPTLRPAARAHSAPVETRRRLSRL